MSVISWKNQNRERRNGDNAAQIKKNIWNRETAYREYRIAKGRKSENRKGEKNEECKRARGGGKKGKRNREKRKYWEHLKGKEKRQRWRKRKK